MDKVLLLLLKLNNNIAIFLILSKFSDLSINLI